MLQLPWKAEDKAKGIAGCHSESRPQCGGDEEWRKEEKYRQYFSLNDHRNFVAKCQLLSKTSHNVI